jgi:MFS family permease
LSLPHTPPKPAEAGGSQAWVKALKLLGLPFVMVLWLVTFLDSSVHTCYFSWTDRFLISIGVKENWVMPVMSIGQVAEILTMAILGTFLKKLGWRTTMILGILGHAVRFAVFAFCPGVLALVIAVNLLHGVCYAFFFATVYIFVDEYFPKDIRSSAQGLFNLMILGLGQLVPNFVCPWLFDVVYTNPETKVVDFRGLFLVPCVSAIVAAVLLALFFHPPKINCGPTEEIPAEAEGNFPLEP